MTHHPNWFASSPKKCRPRRLFSAQTCQLQVQGRLHPKKISLVRLPSCALSLRTGCFKPFSMFEGQTRVPRQIEPDVTLPEHLSAIRSSPRREENTSCTAKLKKMALHNVNRVCTRIAHPEQNGRESPATVSFLGPSLKGRISYRKQENRVLEWTKRANQVSSEAALRPCCHSTWEDGPHREESQSITSSTRFLHWPRRQK